MAYREDGTSNLMQKVMLSGQTQSNHRRELCNMVQSDVDPKDAAAGKERTGPKLMQTQEDRKRRKNAIDRNYRAKRKVESERLKNIWQSFGGIDRMESQFKKLKQMESIYGELEGMESKLNKLNQMESIYGGLEGIESMLNKLELMEAESPVFEKVKAMFGGIDNVLPGLNKLKKTEFQHIVLKPNQMDKRIINTFPGSSYSVQLGDYEIRQMYLKADNLSFDKRVDDFLAKLGKESKSNITFASFKDLDDERQKVGDYCFPISLISTVKAIMNAHGDIATNCFMGPTVVENIYILLCAAIKEMGDLSLQQVTEEIMLKWRDAIKDAERNHFNVEFVVNHLRRIAYAYFGLKARNDRDYWKQMMVTLKAEEMRLKEMERKMNEVKAKEQGLASVKYKMCWDHANAFNDRKVGLFG